MERRMYGALETRHNTKSESPALAATKSLRRNAGLVNTSAFSAIGCLLRAHRQSSLDSPLWLRRTLMRRFSLVQPRVEQNS